MEEEPRTLENSSATQIMEGGLGDLEQEGRQIIATPNAEEEINNMAAEEVPQGGGHEEEVT